MVTPLLDGRKCPRPVTLALRRGWRYSWDMTAPAPVLAVATASTDFTWTLAIDADGRVIYWNRDPKDFATRGVEEVMAGLGDQPLAAGDIVLLHDKLPHSAASVEKILQRLEGTRLKAVTVSALLAAASR